MARIRIRLSWHRPWARKKSAARADASFFEDGANRRPRPDSPELSVFTPAEEAESHRRWRRALLSKTFRGPVSGAERLGFGLSAAALAAMIAREKQTGADEEVHGRDDDTGDVGEVLAALKSAAPATGPTDKAPFTPKATGPAHAFLDSGGDSAFSSPLSSRADSGLGVRRAAPRGSGAPLESRVGGGAERTDAATLRKADLAPADAARAALVAEGAFAVRAPMEAEAVTMAIAMGADAPDAREDQDRAEVKAANSAGAKANGGRAPAEEVAQAKAKDAPPAAEARADQRQGATAEASVREKTGGDAPLILEAKASGGGRSATDAPGRTKARDTAEAVSENEADLEEDAAEAPVEAKAKGVAPTAEAEAGLGRGSAKGPAQAKTVEVEVVETKADTGRGQVDAPGQTKAKDAPPVLEIKTDTARVLAEAPEQTMARELPAIVAAEAERVGTPVSPEAAGRAKAKDAATADLAGQGRGRAEALEQATATDIPIAAAKAEQDQRPIGAAPQQQIKAKDVGAGAVKTDADQGTTDASGKTTDVAATAAKAAPNLEHAKAPGQAKANDVPVAAEVKPASNLEQAQAPGQAKATDAPVVAETKTDTGREQG